MENNNYETEIFEIISHTGEARENIFNALNAAKDNDFEKAKEFMSISDGKMLEAHNVQTKLINEDIKDNGIKISLLMVHAQDQFMTAMSEQFLVTQMIEMYKTINELRRR